MADLVTLRNVEKRYRRGNHIVEIFRGLNFSVPEGEFLALTGPSGSGKTTLLNLIGGLDTAERGEITAVGERLDRLSTRALSAWRARHVGIVFQFYNLLSMLTVEGNVEVPLVLTRLPAAERRRRVHAALELVGLAQLAERKPTQLSGGQQQRVAIARAIVADPTLLVCDEPTGDLDRSNADQIMALFRLLHERHGKTIVMVTHDPRAAGYASRRVLMDKGSLMEDERRPVAVDEKHGRRLAAVCGEVA